MRPNFVLTPAILLTRHRYFPQTQQGADIVASTLKTKVYMPDFFDGHPYPVDKFPPSTDQEKADFQVFWGGIANISNTVDKVTKFAETLKADNIKRIGLYGFCWGAGLSFPCTFHENAKPQVYV